MENDALIQQPESPKKNFLFLFLIVLVFVAVLELFLVLQKSDKFPSAVYTGENQEVEPPLQEGVSEGVININLLSPKASIGNPITFVVKLDSNKKGVVAMDAVVSFDKNIFTVGTVKSSLPGYTAVSNARKNFLEVTLSKDLQTVEIPVLENEDVFSFTLTPKKAGAHKVELLTTEGKSSTKFVDSDTTVFLPKVNSVTVTVK